MKRFWMNTCATLLLLSLSHLSLAHFHYEAAVTTTLQTSNTELTALNISWVYDTEVSQMMLSESENLKTFADGLMHDLAELNYFTQLTLNNKPLQTAAPTQYKLEKIGKGEDTQLKLSFTLPLKKPVSLEGKTRLDIDHTDSSGSAILFYESTNNIRFSKSIAPICIADIKEIPDFKHGESPQEVAVACEI